MLFFLVSRKQFDNVLLTPSGFLILIWILVIILLSLIAPDFYFTPKACLIFLLCIFCFTVGDILGSLKKENYLKNLLIYQSDFFLKKLSKFIIILGFVALLGALLYIQYFISYFGSLSGLLTAGWAVRGALEEMSIPIYIRAILMLGYSCVILSVVYFIICQKIKWFLFLPFISLLLMGVAQAGRAGFMMILVQIFIGSYFKIIYKNAVNFKIDKSKIVSFPEKKLLINSLKLLVVVAVIFIGGDMLRNQNFDLQGGAGNAGLDMFRSYLFGGIGAFSTYIENYDFLSYHTYGYGRFSFSSLYDLLGIHKNQLGIYTDYLRTSSKDSFEVSNVFTAFRQYIDDFGVLGTIFFLLTFGFISGRIFQSAVKGNMGSISICVGIYSILFHSFLLSVTVHNGVLISLILPYIIIKYCKKNIK